MSDAAGAILAVIAPEFRYLNHFEAGLWIVLGLGAGTLALRASRAVIRRDLFILATALIAFGFSDIIEAHTGAWWRPWWLLLWKGLCLAVLLWLLIGHLRRRCSR